MTTQPTPIAKLVTFTARIECSEAEAERLKKLLEDAAVKGTGHWGYDKTEAQK